MIAEYVEAVIEGMAHYLPEPSLADDTTDLDPDWPDTQAEVKKKGNKIEWSYWVWFCSKIGQDFKAQTIRSMIALQKCWLKENGIEIGEGESDI